MALTTYVTLVSTDVSSGRGGDLVAAWKSQAEAESFRTVRAWLLQHLEEPEGSGLDRTPAELLEDLEAFWESESVDPHVEAWARAVAVDEYRELQGTFDGKKWSDRVLKNRRKRINRIRHTLIVRGYLMLETGDDPDGDRVAVKRFERL